MSRWCFHSEISAGRKVREEDPPSSPCRDRLYPHGPVPPKSEIPAASRFKGMGFRVWKDPQKAFAATVRAESKAGHWGPGSPFYLCLLPPLPAWSGISICCLSLCSLLSVQADWARRGHYQMWGDGAAGPTPLPREDVLFAEAAYRSLCERQTLAAEGCAALPELLDCLKLRRGLRCVRGTHAQRSCHPEAPLISSALSGVQRLRPRKEEQGLLVALPREGCQSAGPTRPWRLQEAREKAQGSKDLGSAVGGEYLAKQRAPQVPGQVPGLTPA